MLLNGEPQKGAGRERRTHPRLAVDSSASVFLLDVRARVEGAIVDVSIGGCCIRSKARFPTGIYRRLEVEFRLGGMAFRLAGVVQSMHDRNTIGIRFLDLSERKLEQLSMLVVELEEAAQRECGGDDGPRAEPS